MRVSILGAIVLLGCGNGGAAGSGAGGGGSSGASGGRGSGGSGGAGGGQTDAHPDSSGTSDATSGRSQSVYLTFYGWPDNSPPGGAIAYPKNGGFATVHNTAGGTGSYDDPITFATDQAELPVGTLLFAPVIEKYLVMEDDCAECDTDWSASGKWHIDVWMNSNGSADSNAVLACEDRWTQSSTVVEIGPPPGRAATAPPLFDAGTNVCRTTP
jgi:3D (Asp-Asp-Asp) domain-containing protein